MTSIDRKVKDAGWSKRSYAEARNEINRALDGAERVVRYKRKKCDHQYQYVEYKTFTFWNGGWHVFKCSKCKRQYTTSNDNKANKLRNIQQGGN